MTDVGAGAVKGARAARFFVHPLPRFICCLAAILGSMPAGRADNLLNEAPPPPSNSIDTLTYQGKVNLQGEYQSNPLLRNSDVKAILGVVISPEVILTTATADAVANLDARLDASKFDQPGFSSNDLHLNYHTLQQLERFSAGLDGAVDIDTTRTSEVQFSGVNVVGIRHRGLTFQPQVFYQLNELDKIIVSGVANISRYQNNIFYENYHVLDVTPSFQHVFSPTLLGGISLKLDRFETDNRSLLTVDTISPSLGGTYVVSPLLSVTAQGGYQRTQRKIRSLGLPFPLPFPIPIRQPAPANDFDFSLSVSYDLPQNKLAITAGRQQTPLATGDEIETTNVNISDSYTISTAFEASLRLFYQISSRGASTAISQSNYFTASPLFTYHLGRFMNVNIGYTYQQRGAIQSIPTASGNSFIVGLVYSPDQGTLKW